MHASRRAALGLVLGLALELGLSGAACAQVDYSFGVLPQRSALLTAQYWNPILEYVTKASGVSLLLRTARTAPEMNAATAAGDYDFVYSNTLFQPMMRPAGYRVILRPKSEAITGQIVTLKDAPIKTLADLDGKTVGFPSQAAFIGYAVPMDHLLRQGIAVTPIFGGNQEGVMAQLKAGRVIAAGVNDQVMHAFAQRENLAYRVLWTSDSYHNLPVAAHPRVPNAAVERVRAAFIAMDDSAEGHKVLLESAKLIAQDPPYGFIKGQQSDYQNYLDFYQNTLVKDIK